MKDINLNRDQNQVCNTFDLRLKECAQKVDLQLKDILTSFPNSDVISQRLWNAMEYATLSTGKRFRPFLVMECANLFGVSDEAALNTAAAVECIHCYSLVHDDLPAMDNDDYRRGRLTTHKAFDEATAILVGDALQTLAFEILADPKTDSDPLIRTVLIQGLARASGRAGMVGGQMLDLTAEHDLGLQTKPIDHVKGIQNAKTGALIEFSAVGGAILGRAPSEKLVAIKNYAKSLGLAFQIADDLLDVEGLPDEVGKATGKDAAAGKATFVSILGIAEARNMLQRITTDAIESLNVFGSEAHYLIDAVRFMQTRKH
ncbi:MAG: polyprenyl synthetase family protein [Hyphomicrobium sp.]